jgi:xanthine dehydrogenase accessory factor
VVEAFTAQSLDTWPLFGFSDDVRSALGAALGAGQPAALATIVGLSGGGPRPIGTQMLIATGQVTGFLSGGCLEADVAGHAQGVLRTGEPARLLYGEGSPWPDIRLMCGASIDVLVEKIAPDDLAAARLLALTEQRTPAVWLTDGARRACGPLDAAPLAWDGAFRRLYLPMPRLVVLGSDPTALAVASLGAQAGWETALVRPKGPSEAPPLPNVAYHRAAPGEALAAIGLDPWTAVVVASHDAELDHAALVAALPSRAFYVGALGSRRRLPERMAQLEAAGVGSADIERLHAPLGLDIGGKAPWQVAIATIAQVIALWCAAEAESGAPTRS